MRISLVLLLFSSAAIVLSGCPLSGDDSEQDVLDSVASEVTGQTPDVQADQSLPDPTGEDGLSPATDSVAPDLENAPCIALAPSGLDFGGVQCLDQETLELTIESCGAVPLELYGVGLSPESHPDFSLDLSALSHEPTPDAPLTIPPGATVSVQVVFAPTSASPVDDAGQLVLAEAAVRIDSNAVGSPENIAVHGASVTIEGPVAVIQCQEGNEVVPGTVLHLTGNESYQGCEKEVAIKKWQWEVDRPEGSTSQFIPSYSHPTPSFEVDLAGAYAFYLVVYDENDTPSCFPAEYEVIVIPDEAIRIELFWHTPGDPDEADSGPAAGADLDLHLLHPLAEGPDIDNDGEPNGWFDAPWDCFWFNPNPDWGPPGPEGNPGCPEKNYDYGPESTTFLPGEELTYRVGVHDWDDHGYGPSYATVRVYLYGTLAFEFADVKLQKLLTWEVCEIEWPSGKIKPILDENGEPNILPPINCGFTGCPPWE